MENCVFSIWVLKKNWVNCKCGALRVLLVMGFYWGPSDLDRIRLLSCQVGGGWNGSLRI